MNDIYNHNVNLFNQVEECDAYLLRKEHQIRADLVIDLLTEVIDPDQTSSQKLLSVACSTGI